MKTLNRAAVVVATKQAFLEWLRDLGQSNRELTMADLRRDPSIYLFPECSFEPELLEHLEDACAKIFEQELKSWDRLEETWPTDRTGYPKFANGESLWLISCFEGNFGVPSAARTETR